MFRAKQKPTQEAIIEATSLEELLKDAWARSYSWNAGQTKLVLKKCTNLIDYISIQTWVFKCIQQRSVDYQFSIEQEVIDLIYKELCQAVTSFLRDDNLSELEKLSIIQKAHKKLGRVWIDQDNSLGRKMLQRRLEVVWLKTTLDFFKDLKLKEPNNLSKYEELFALCKEDDPLILEIAETLNSLS